MAFLDRLTKGVSRAAEQAKFEADKLRRVNKLNSDVSDLVHGIEQAKSSIGAKVIELRAAGELQVPELDEIVARIEELEERLVAKREELEAARASKFEDEAAAPAPEPASQKCPNCGAEVPAGAKFCGSCGAKIE